MRDLETLVRERLHEVTGSAPMPDGLQARSWGKASCGTAAG
jgi:hypothetical protein